MSNSVASQQIISKVINFYHDSLKEKPKLLKFLQRQKLSSEILTALKIGSSGNKIVKLIETNKIMREQIRNAGLIDQKGREIMSGYITFPVIDLQGVIIDIIGYKFKINPKKDKTRIIYLKENPEIKLEAETIQEIIKKLTEFRERNISADNNSGKVNSDDDHVFQFGKRAYRIRGLNSFNLNSMKVNLKIIQDGINYLDTIDLYISRFRDRLIGKVSELYCEDKSVIQKEIETLIDHLEKIRIQKTGNIKVELSPEEKEQALNILKNENLISMISKDLTKSGIAGEEKNKLMLYMAFTSRKLKKPLSIIVKGDSAGGKSYLVNQVLKLFPDEDIKNFTEITEKSLYYMNEDELMNKILVIFERHGSEASDYSIRSLQSEEYLKIAVAMKSAKTNDFRTVERKVKGPVSYVETTTKLAIHPENATRMFDLYIDESENQTEKIYNIQNLTYLPEKRIAQSEIEKLISKHQNMQRVLESVNIKIPYVEFIQFPKNKLRLRRDRMRFLALIEAFAFLHQFQRTAETINEKKYIIADLEDYRMTYDLASEIMIETLATLHQKSRELFEKMKIIKKPEFAICDIEEATGWNTLKIRRYIRQLIDEDYLEQKTGNSQGKRAIYCFSSGKEMEVEKMEGLPTPEELEKHYHLFKGHDKQVKTS